MSPRTLACVSSFIVLSGCYAGPLLGEEDKHCGSTVVTPNPASCNVASDGGMSMMEAAEVRFNAEADDDDCKYHVKYSAKPIATNTDVTFTVTVTRKVDGMPALDLDPELEASLGETHPAPNSNAETKSLGGGVYTIGPVRFDLPGNWNLKFHFAEQCTDIAEDSPHGHVTFAFSVP
ncbi:MAG: hypothetical protein U0228_08540 [Myxococcaceae bacterium]